jgi:hypothetical protein
VTIDSRYDLDCSFCCDSSFPVVDAAAVDLDDEDLDPGFDSRAARVGKWVCYVCWRLYRLDPDASWPGLGPR